MLSDESRTRYKVCYHRLLVALQYLLGAGLSDDHATTHRLRVRQKFVEPNYRYLNLVDDAARRNAHPLAVSDFVKALHQVAGLLEFDRQEKRSRHIDATNLAALLRIREATRQREVLAFV